MLIICNGVFKSGSSWLHSIVIEILREHNLLLSIVDEKYTNNINSPTTIIESNLIEFISKEDYKKNNYITKSHYHKIDTLSRKYDKNVKFIFIDRDIKDAIISHYHHFKNKFSLKISFSSYYFFIGKLKAYEIYLFNQRYIKFFGKECFVSYEDLKEEFSRTVLKICHILDLPDLTIKQIEKIEKETSIDSLRKKIKKGEIKYYSTVKKEKWRMIRKGRVGDWKYFYSPKQNLSIQDIIDGKASLFTKLTYYIFFTLRRKLGSVE